jgi:hypothetical protein
VADPSLYLQPNDLSTYGVDDATPDHIRRASRLIDGFCRRARWGLTWVPDAVGNPCYMAGASPDLVWTSSAAIEPGTNVVVAVTGPTLYPEIIGRPVVLDAATPTLCEAPVITAINTPTNGTITLGAVANAHASNTQLQGGRQIFEERNLPQDRSLARVAHWPIQRVLSGLGRYSYGRRSQQVEGNYSEFNLLAILQQFGGPPAWVPLDTQQLGVNPTTGELWIPAGLLLAYYSDVRLHYVAGWSPQTLPDPIKQACANIIGALREVRGTPLVSSLFRSAKAGDTALERIADIAIDAETRELLTPFRAHLYF